MPSRIYRKRWPQWVASVVVLSLLIGGWWLEERYLKPSGWHRPAGQLTAGEYRVRRVVDGDTLALDPNDLRVRLQGIDTPETVKKNTAVEAWGPEATEYTQKFLQSAQWVVRIEIDGEPVDRYGRHLAFVWHDGRLLNEELVSQGLAHAKTTFDYSDSMKQRLRSAQLQAQANRLGIWSGPKVP